MKQFLSIILIFLLLAFYDCNKKRDNMDLEGYPKDPWAEFLKFYIITEYQSSQLPYLEIVSCTIPTQTNSNGEVGIVRGVDFVIECTIKNNGISTNENDEVYLTAYLSNDSTVTNNDNWLNTITLDYPINSGSSVDVSLVITGSMSCIYCENGTYQYDPGTYYLGAIVSIPYIKRLKLVFGQTILT